MPSTTQTCVRCKFSLKLPGQQCPVSWPDDRCSAAKALQPQCRRGLRCWTCPGMSSFFFASPRIKYVCRRVCFPVLPVWFVVFDVGYVCLECLSPCCVAPATVSHCVAPATVSHSFCSGGTLWLCGWLVSTAVPYEWQRFSLEHLLCFPGEAHTCTSYNNSIHFFVRMRLHSPTPPAHCRCRVCVRELLPRQLKTLIPAGEAVVSIQRAHPRAMYWPAIWVSAAPSGPTHCRPSHTKHPGTLSTQPGLGQTDATGKSSA